MATITLTQILGGDNIAASRVTINQNFQALANAFNSIGTSLDTAATPGPALGVGSVIINAYTRPLTTQIFTCQASGLFAGNLNVSQNLGVTLALTVGGNGVFHKSLTFDGTGAVGSTLSIGIPTIATSGYTNTQLLGGAMSSTNSLSIQPSSLAGTGTSRNIVTASTFGQVSAIHLDYSTYSGTGTTNATSINLPSVTDANVQYGQVITVMVDKPADAGTLYTGGLTGTFGIGLTTLDPCYNEVSFNGSGNLTSTNVRQSMVTLFAGENGWRVLSYTGADCSIS